MWCILYVTPLVTLKKKTMFWSNLRNDSVLKAEFNSRGRSTVRYSIRVEIFRWKIHTRVPGERRRVAGCVISSHQIVSVFLMKWIRLIFRLGRLPSAGEARRGGQRQPAGFMLISSDVGSDVLSWVQRGRERGGAQNLSEGRGSWRPVRRTLSGPSVTACPHILAEQSITRRPRTAFAVDLAASSASSSSACNSQRYQRPTWRRRPKDLRV